MKSLKHALHTIHFVTRKNLSYKKIVLREDNIYAKRETYKMKADTGNTGGGKIAFAISKENICVRKHCRKYIGHDIKRNGKSGLMRKHLIN